MRLSRALSVLVLMAAVLLPTPARADRPVFMHSYPYNGAILKSSQVQDFTATYHIDLAGPPASAVVINDSRGVVVTGDTSLSGPTSSTGGKRSITFKPTNPFRESAGEYHVQVSVRSRTDPAGEATNEFRFRIDDTAADVPTITSPMHQQHVGTSYEVHGRTSPFSRVRLFGTGSTIDEGRSNEQGDFVFYVTSPEGVRDIWATAIDGTGNESAGSTPLTIRVDGTPPAAPVITEPTEGTVIRSSQFTVRGTAEIGSTVTVRKGSTVVGTASSNFNGSWAAGVVLPDDTYTLTAIATDLAGNPSPVSGPLTVVVNATLGAPRVNAPFEGQVVTSQQVLFQGTSAPGWTIQLSQSGVLLGTTPVASNGAWSKTLTLGDGIRKISVQAVLGSDQTGTTVRTFTVDTTGPEPPVVHTPHEGGVIRTERAYLSGTTEPLAKVSIFNGPVRVAHVTALSSGAWSAEGSFLPGPQTIAVFATDRAGNVGATRTVNFTADGTRPTTEILTPDPHPAVLEFAVWGTAHDNDRVAQVIVNYREVVRGLVKTEAAVLTPVGGQNVEWRATGEGLRPGHYTVQVLSYDRSGNEAISKYVAVVKFTLT